MDGAALLHGVAPLDGLTVDVVTWDGASTWTNITANVTADDTNYANDFLPNSSAAVFIGSTSKFAMFRFLKGGGANYAAGAGAIIIKYFNGSDFASAISGKSDGSAVAANCFAQDGYVGFTIPRNWAIGADAYNAALDADKFYIMVQTTSSSNPDADADILCPCGSQYFEVAFAAMDFSGPLGRKLQDEILVLDRNKMSAKGHYIKSADDPLYEPIALSFSAMIDDTHNKSAIMEALVCGDPDSTYWTAAGTTSKGTTKNDGTYANPGFADTNKKCVNVQILWSGATYGIGMAFYECYFPEDEITIAEAEDGITLSAAGGCYGVMEIISGFGNKY
jgi:hypothetical protein